ncbi:MAG: hypothetical protein PHV74_08760 [Dehalococcoidia bacterium]|nr:hypothetical protein [Dehalococcoidia bacterium]
MVKPENELPRRKQRGIRCHARLDKPAPYLIRGIQFLDSGLRRNDDSPQATRN